MKNKLIGLLAFPRDQLRDDLELEECPHAGLYAPDDVRCTGCWQGMECAWVSRNDECAPLGRRSVGELAAWLDVGASLIQARVGHWGHNPHLCHCDACDWLRHAGMALRQVHGARRFTAVPLD